MAHEPLVMSYPYVGIKDCLISAVSCNMYKPENRHSEIRLSVVKKIIIEWEYSKDFIVDL